jgi:MerR family mercuric resistance operon transcriptional regulator
MTAMAISELARACGVGVETVRFYQRKGLLADPRPAAHTTVPGRRHYGPEDQRRLRFIRKAQRAGFTLAEVAELLRLDSTGDRPRAREMARARIAQLDSRIVELRQARQALESLAKECAQSDAGPCPIIEAFGD